MYIKDISKRRFLRIVLSLLVIICILFTNVSIARSGLEEERENLPTIKTTRQYQEKHRKC